MLIIFIYLFILFLSRLHMQFRAQSSAQTHDPKIKTWAEIKGQVRYFIDWATQVPHNVERLKNNYIKK